jgi:hypothetical protein
MIGGIFICGVPCVSCSMPVLLLGYGSWENIYGIIFFGFKEADDGR